MSLINDALRRARQAQQRKTASPAPVSPGAPLLPVEYGSNTSRLTTLAPTIALALLGVAALVLAWKWPGHRDDELEASARSVQPQVVVNQSPAPRKVPPTPVQEEPTPPQAPVLAETPSGNAAVNEGSPGAEASPSPKPSMSGPIYVPPAPAPNLKLQAIIYHPTRPSAIINGRTLFIGDRIDNMMLSSVGRQGVIMMGNGQTNRLAAP